MTLGWSAYLTDFGDTAEPETYQALLDILFHYTGGYSDDNVTSTLGTHSDVTTYSVSDTVDGASFGEADKTLTYAYVSLRGSYSHGDPDSISVTGTSYAVVPTLT